jgi:hypothetical protein
MAFQSVVVNNLSDGLGTFTDVKHSANLVPGAGMSDAANLRGRGVRLLVMANRLREAGNRHADTLAAKAAELLDEATKIEAAALDAQPLEGD